MRRGSLNYIFVPIINGYYDIGDIDNTDYVFYDDIEEITDFSVDYAVLDALSLEYYFSIEIH